MPFFIVMHTSDLSCRYLAATLIDKAIEVKFIGGVYGNQRPTEFLCLLLKLLQIQPDKEILVEYLQADEFKCARNGFPARVMLLKHLQVSPSAIRAVHTNDI